MKACDDAGAHLPTLEELAAVASYQYDANITAEKQFKGEINDSKNKKTYNLSAAYYWLTEYANIYQPARDIYAYGRSFYPDKSNFTSSTRNQPTIKARCVKN